MIRIERRIATEPTGWAARLTGPVMSLALRLLVAKDAAALERVLEGR